MPMVETVLLRTSVYGQPPQYRKQTRRKSVLADIYPIYPKSDEQRFQLHEAVKKINLFRGFESDQIHQVLDAMFERVVKSGETIIKQGDTGDNFYVIISGSYNVYLDGQHCHTFHGKGYFGEMALMNDQPRAATVQAATDGKLWAMDRKTFRVLMLSTGETKFQKYESFLKSVPMLAKLKEQEQANIVEAFVAKSFQKDDIIFQQGETPDGMYFVQIGLVSIQLKQETGENVEIAVLKPNAYFGELSLVTHRPRAATAVALIDVQVAFIRADKFERLLLPCMDIIKQNIGGYKTQMIRMFGSKWTSKDIQI